MGSFCAELGMFGQAPQTNHLFWLLALAKDPLSRVLTSAAAEVVDSTTITTSFAKDAKETEFSKLSLSFLLISCLWLARLFPGFTCP